MWPLLVHTAGGTFLGSSLGWAVVTGADTLGGYTATAPEGRADAGVRFDGNEVWMGLGASALRVPRVRADGTDGAVWLAPVSVEAGVGSDLVVAQAGVYVGGGPRALVVGGYLRSVPIPLDGAVMGLELRGFNAFQPGNPLETTGFTVALRWETGGWDNGTPVDESNPAWTPDDAPVREDAPPAERGEAPAPEDPPVDGDEGSAPSTPATPQHHDAPADDADPDDAPSGAHHDAPAP